jgi:hypothetical protein
MMANGRLALNLDLKTRKKWNPEGLFGVVAGTKTPFKSVMGRLGSAPIANKPSTDDVVESGRNFFREFYQLLVIGFV